MKFSISVAAALLPAAALSRSHYKRDDITTTDQYLFHITLAQFNIYRDADIPATLDFTSDGCTASPDNPLGFDYVPACYRHDFGYTNYRAQTRFTKSAKAAIDLNFLGDLKTQCDAETLLESICDALAEVYYAAVMAFGGSDAGKKRAAPFQRSAGYGYNNGTTIIGGHPSTNLTAITIEGIAVDWVAVYDEKLAVYKSLVAEAEANGDLEKGMAAKIAAAGL